MAAFCRTNSKRARQMLLELSNYLRRNIKDQRQYITLEDGLKQIESYLVIEHARFGDRIQFKADVMPDAKEWSLPPLIIQPLVENADKHGISCKEANGKVCTQATRENGSLIIQVKDDGVGIPGHAVTNAYKKTGSIQFEHGTEQCQSAPGAHLRSGFPTTNRQHPQSWHHYHRGSAQRQIGAK